MDNEFSNTETLKVEEAARLMHKNPCFVRQGLQDKRFGLRDYEWEYTETNGIITNFEMGIKNKTLPVIFLSENGKKTRELRNRAYSIVEKDVRAGKRGRLYVNDYYLECNIYGMANSKYLLKECFLMTTMKVCTDRPMWKKAKLHQFKHQEITEDIAGKDYPYDYPKDLMPKPIGTQQLNNDFDFASEFIMTIYGATLNPSVVINNHTYSLNGSLEESEYVVIDGQDIARTIEKHSGDTVINYFNNRHKEESIFEKIPSGLNGVSWNNEFDFDIVLIDSRAEPIWSWSDVKAYDVADIEKVGDTYYLLDSKGKYIRDSDYEPIAVTEGGVE